MHYLIFYAPGCGPAAMAYGEVIRHRRHEVLLRELAEWAMVPNGEDADGVLLMVGDVEPDAMAMAELGAYYPTTVITRIAPGDEPWPITEAEAIVMGPLNKLRHDAALLGIEIDSSYDETRLAALIQEAASKLTSEADREREKAEQITRDADQLEAARKAVAEAMKPDHTVKDTSDPLFGIDISDVLQVRDVAKALGCPTNPNPHTKAETIVKAIRAFLGQQQELAA
jgi:hypothetical protein